MGISIFARLKFLSTPSVGRTTRGVLPGRPGLLHFYPRPPWGGRHAKLEVTGDLEVFLSTPSVGRTTGGHLGYERQRLDFYPRPPWGGRLRM